MLPAATTTRILDHAPRSVLVGWTAFLAGLGVLLALRDQFQPWVWMWIAVAAILGGFKLIAWLRFRAEARSLSRGRLAGYFFLWPGTRPQDWLALAAGDAGVREGRPPLWANGLLHLALGALFVWVLPGLVGGSVPLWTRCWLGMIGFSLFVHFGLLDLLAVTWRRRGVAVGKLFCAPLRSLTLDEFWSRRWNLVFSAFATHS